MTGQKRIEEAGHPHPVISFQKETKSRGGKTRRIHHVVMLRDQT